MTKVCPKCGVEKEVNGENWPKRRQTKTGFDLSICLDCTRLYNKAYYRKNRDRFIYKAKEWHDANRERYNECKRLRYRSDDGLRRRYQQEWNVANKAAVNARLRHSDKRSRDGMGYSYVASILRKRAIPVTEEMVELERQVIIRRRRIKYLNQEERRLLNE
jgi:hypothetical protein